ncbi:MAG: endonuclease/exonuclease/phosphatase family protein [Verrucomicrobiota bacterium]|nr:endonuclease/exonuclease/phosphatase family protein [Limisphaera sp.]MDW8383038.1 endonuclease/exonuclease/phosphatase family protein [Verrucomicrobiota bacterium]
MKMGFLLRIVIAGSLGGCIVCTAAEPQSFRVATYNLANYILQEGTGRPVKSEEAKAQIGRAIQLIQPDVLALQEVGGLPALEDLRQRLQLLGLDYPWYELAPGWDTNIQVALLSRWPILARRSHTNETYLLNGRRLHVSRAILEVDVEIRSRYRLTMFVVHLKSRRPVGVADQADMRLEEARILRSKIEERLARNPRANLLVAGDLNDVKNSRTLRTVIGSGRHRLTDTRPAERNGDTIAAVRPRADPPRITWTHFYEVEDSYSRVDYILLAPGMVAEWIPEESYVLAFPNWGLASDHRPVVATFIDEDR